MSTGKPPPWPRPRPLIGDASSSAERAANPMSWAFPAAARLALAEVIAARRDVRRFRPDPVGDEIIDELLAAGHAAPSVGHSQPWRFIIVTDPQLRANAAVMADRARLAQAQQLDADSARHLLSLQLEGIREAPVGVVVCCDRRARPAGVLGRATFPDADLWSCACAIENIWLTARACGLGLGWVTLFDPDELNALLRLPEGVVTLGWLCLGWPDELPPAPGLERQGWSRRLGIADVVARDQWPGPDAASPPRDRAAETAGTARVTARDREDRLLAAPGSLGLLGDTLLRVESVTARDAPGTLVIAAADHPVADLGVSAFPRSTTRLVARALAEGQGQGTAMARAAGMGVFLADCGIDGTSIKGWRDLRPPGARGDLASADALESGAVAQLLAAGEQLGHDLAARGPVALGEVGIGNTTVASTLAAALLAVPAQEVVGRGAGSDTAIVARKQHIVEQALARMSDRIRPPGQLAISRVEDLLAGVGGPEQALLTGVCLGVAQADGIVVLDGFLTSASALVAVRYRPEVQAHLVAGHVSAEPAHRLVLDALGLEPVLDLRLRAGEGVGAVLALSLIAQAKRARQLTATTD
jgi:nicotinate-nucleotide--dimethylbenzimidazole phosphoribosyltransferase